jgi:hypothetical protein
MSYRKNCVHCQQEILLNKDDSDKWHAYELTGDPHRCQNKTGPKSIVKECTLCGETIELLKIEDRYRPYNENRTLHHCIRRKEN